MSANQPTYTERMEGQLREAIRSRAATLRAHADSVERLADFKPGRHIWAVQDVQKEVLGCLNDLALTVLYSHALDIHTAEWADRAPRQPDEELGG